jgi:hypothetical protein
MPDRTMSVRHDAYGHALKPGARARARGGRRKPPPSGTVRSPMSAPPDRPAVHDLWPRLLISPVFGLVIPQVSGLVDHQAQGRGALAASYMFFILLAFAIWEGNRRLYFRFRNADTWFTHAWQRVAVLLGCVFLYTVPVSLIALLSWRVVSGDEAATGRAILTAVLLIVVCTLFIVHVYETVFLLRDWAGDRLRSERLQRAAAEAELEMLKREVSPHVLFNNLNALAQLVDADPRRASTFVLAFAESYRHTLASRRRPLVTLGEELVLLEHHAVLAQIRYPGALRVVIEVPEEARGRLQLPPVTLPELLDNAVKHNALSAEQPVTFDVRLEGDQVVVRNDWRPTSGPVPSTGVGLSNLQHRFDLTTGTTVSWTHTDDQFVVRLGAVSLSCS